MSWLQLNFLLSVGEYHLHHCCASSPLWKYEPGDSIMLRDGWWNSFTQMKHASWLAISLALLALACLRSLSISISILPQ
ncbi:hypothetical protein F0562_033423 [Nyssa sinensis]|uniref:Uncharacterized protein n=1 Tax=Nyssa sinensis TaxID=561372 RepID=A0A5J5AFW5_9ASTE|nr:hypothetical protein F0562_033423 [Nyssa sinensis]